MTHSNWAAPIVQVLKHDGSIRLYGDYRVTVNQAAGPSGLSVASSRQLAKQALQDHLTNLLRRIFRTRLVEQVQNASIFTIALLKKLS